MKFRNERVEGITESYTDRVELGMRCWFDQVIEGFNKSGLDHSLVRRVRLACDRILQ